MDRSCGFWDFDLNVGKYVLLLILYEWCGFIYFYSTNNGGWSNKGVELIKENSTDTSVVCHSYHLTSFAVLVSIEHKPEQVTDLYSNKEAVDCVFFLGQRS